MTLVRTVSMIALLASTSGCMTLPATREALRAVQPNEVRAEFGGTVREVADALVASAEACGPVWRQSFAGMVGLAAAPSFKPKSEVSADGTSGVVEIWSMNALSPDYIFELFELHRLEGNRVEVVHFRGKGHESNAPRVRHLETWVSAGKPTCS